MNEETLIFKAYSRGLLRLLKRLKKAMDDNNFQDAQKLIDELIKDAQNSIGSEK